MAIGDAGLTAKSSTYVGVDPVAVAVRTPGEVWVVNRISDSVSSIVDTTTTPPHVVRTLLVGDEPEDIVFSGDKAFIATAHRGQQRTDPSIAAVPGAGDPQLTQQGIGRADIWVFDGTNLGTTVGGTPLKIVTLFGEPARGLAVTPDGKTVYAAIYHSGNMSTQTSSELPCSTVGSTTPCSVAGNAVPGGAPGPATNYNGVAAPQVSVLLHSATGSGGWTDVLGRDWSAMTEFSLPDEDVFAIDTTSLTTTANAQHVGTTLYNVAINPASGKVYVSNTEARNDLRFEGPGTFAGATLQGDLAEARITVLTSNSVTPHRINSHIDYRVLPAPAGTKDHSLAIPLNMVVSADGATLYVSAFGSSKIGVLSTAELEADTLNPTTESANYVTVTGGGPSGLVLDATRGKIYVATRFDDGVSVVDVASHAEASHVLLSNPEPPQVTAGRPVSLRRDEGQQQRRGVVRELSSVRRRRSPRVGSRQPRRRSDDGAERRHDQARHRRARRHQRHEERHVAQLDEGPMTTQTLRGMVNHGPMHWRGDRVAGFFGSDTSTGAPYDSNLAFKNFIVAFNSLTGLDTMFSSDDMQTYSSFALAIAMPPNAVRALDNSLTTSQAAGKQYFLGCDGYDSTKTPTQQTKVRRERQAARRLLRPLLRRRRRRELRLRLHRLPRPRPGERLLRHRRRLELRGAAADREGPAAAQPLRQGRHVRQRRAAEHRLGR